MNPTEDHLAEKYQNGKMAEEIEHFLIMRLHELNTIAEIETLKEKILDMMLNAYFSGQERLLITETE